MLGLRCVGEHLIADVAVVDDVVAQAQKIAGLEPFDLVICDEAHRTTGATLAGAEESAFVRVHDPEYLKASKRLYMTATPRIYDDASKAKAGKAQAVLASMDDEDVFGPEFYRLGFGEAVGLGMLTDYKSDFQDLDTRGAILFGARQVTTSVIERTIGGSLIQRLISGAPGRDGDDALLDRGGQLAFFEDREAHLTEALAMRLRKAGKADGFAVFNAAQDHILAAAKADIDLRVFEAFKDGLEAMPEGEARDLMAKVLDLYALTSIEEDKGWFIEHGRITTSRSKAVTTRINELCAELRPHAVDLTKAFGIPESWLENDLIDLGQDRAGVTA